jgi:hypothetical protein
VKTAFWEVALRPDNLFALGLLPGFGALFLWWWREARKNDRLEAEGGLEAVARDMQGPVPPPARSLGREDVDRVHTWPHLLRVELLVTLAVLTFLMVIAIVLDAPLEQEADPARTPNPSKAPWYFLGLQELLVYFDPWIAGVALPTLIVLGLCAVPYLDVNPAGDGWYAWRPRRIALSLFWGGFALWLGLIVIGTFFRGPGWGWFWPWEAWDLSGVTPRRSRSWPEVLGLGGGPWASVFGGATVLSHYGLAVFGWLWIRRRPLGVALGPGRWFIAAFLGLTMLAIPLKMILHHALDVKYVWVTPWFSL